MPRFLVHRRPLDNALESQDAADRNDIQSVESPPATLVYPARFKQVVGVSGFMSDKTPYFREGVHRQMHGSFGPESVMDDAMAAFTPNTPWAAMGCEELVTPDGAGTSSPTPQCAAAATLWLQNHRPEPDAKWKRVEAVRHALFSSADKSPDAGKYYLGRGLLRADAALEVAYDDSSLTKAAEDSVSLSWLRLIGALEAEEAVGGADAMFETEALQTYLRAPKLQQIVDQADPAAMTWRRRFKNNCSMRCEIHRQSQRRFGLIWTN